MSTLGIIASSHKLEAARVTINLTISSDTNNYNIQSNRGGTYSSGNTDLTLTINSGVVVGSTSASNPALETGSSWAEGDTITIINNGTIKGCGGNGGAGADADYLSPTDNGEDGEDGGTGFKAEFATTFTNNGSVYGGGGGGGGGTLAIGLEEKTLDTTANGGGGGGGGAGVNSGTGGAGGVASNATDTGNGATGSNGTATAGGSGGIGGIINSITAGSGGAGGALGLPGNAGTSSSSGFNPNSTTPGDGGLAGFYEEGGALINDGDGIGGVVGGRTSLYFALEILGVTSWVQAETTDTFSSQSITIPTGTKSIIMMGGIGTNAGRDTLHTGASLGGNALTEVISVNNTPAEYTFDSVIYAGNTSLTGTQTATFTYTNRQTIYGSGHYVIFLNKEFNSFVPSSSDSAFGTSNPITLSLTKYGEGLQLGTATVRNTSGTITNMPNVATLLHPRDNRNSSYGWGITSGTYNESTSLSTAASLISNDFGETFCAVTFAPTKFDN